MTTNVKNFKTIGDNYLGVEVKDGFDNFEIGNTGIEIEVSPRTGVGKYTNFSKHVKIISANSRCKHEVGEHVWVSHLVVDRKFKAGKEFGEYEGCWVYPFDDGGVAFSGDDVTTAESEEWILCRNRKHGVSSAGNVYAFTEENPNILEVVNSNEEGIPVGSEIEFIHGKRVEFWQKEQQYWAVMKGRVCSVDGMPYGNYYELDEFEGLEYEHKGILMKGKKAAQIRYGVEPGKHQRLARLNNPNLPHHGKVAVVYQTKRKSRYSEHVIYLVEEREIVMDFNLFKGQVVS